MPRRATTIPNNTPPPPSDDSNEPQTLEEKRIEAVTGIFQLAQFGTLTFGQFADAGAIGEHSGAMTKEIVALAEKNKQIASKVDLLIEVGPYAGLVAVALPFALQILCNHGILKPENFVNAGVVTKETLEHRMKSALLKQQMEAMQAQQQLEEEMRLLHEEMMEKTNANGHKEDATIPDGQ